MVAAEREPCAVGSCLLGTDGIYKIAVRGIILEATRQHLVLVNKKYVVGGFLLQLSIHCTRRPILVA